MTTRPSSPNTTPLLPDHQDYIRRVFTAAADHWDRTNAQQQDQQNDTRQVSGGGSAVPTS